MTHEMVTDEVALAKVLAGPHGDFLLEGLRKLAQGIMEAEVTALAGAAPHERSESRSDRRNGYREREWLTRLGQVTLAVPRLREGSYMPSFLEPRRRWERALVAAVQEAYVLGLSTRRVDELVETLGNAGLSKSTVSRLCAELDEEARAFRERPLEEAVPYVWLDAVYEKVREGGRVITMAVVVAIGVTDDGTRTVLGIDVGQTESEAFWTEFLRSLVRRGLSGVQLVISDAHEGLKAAIAKVLNGASWQRCRVHVMRNVLCHVPRGQQPMVAALIRTIFAASSQQDARRQLEQVADTLREKCPKAAQALSDAAEDVLAYKAFPEEHHSKIHSTNPLERQNREIRRRTRVVGVFPNRASILRLVTLLLADQHDEWQVADRVYMTQTSLAKLTGATPPARLMKGTATG